MTKIGMVFTNFNNSSYTESLLKSLSPYQDYIDVVIVDNFSDNSNVEILRNLESKYNEVNFIYLKYNVGYFQGLNYGIDFLRSNGSFYDYFIVGNNDLVFNRRLMTDHEKIKNLCEKNLIIAPSLIDTLGNHQNPHVSVSISKLRGMTYDLFYYNYYVAILLYGCRRLFGDLVARGDEINSDWEGEIEQGFGACYIISNLFYEHFDMLFSPVFLMHEEYFLSHQLKSKGHRIYYSRVLDIEHVGKSSTGQVPSKKLYQLSKASYLTSKFFGG